jgi:hypothetical protein
MLTVRTICLGGTASPVVLYSIDREREVGISTRETRGKGGSHECPRDACRFVTGSFRNERKIPLRSFRSGEEHPEILSRGRAGRHTKEGRQKKTL